MRKLGIALTALIALVAAAAAYRSRSVVTTSVASARLSTSPTPTPTAPTAPPPASAPLAKTGRVGADAPAAETATPQEEQLVAMYEEITAAFAAHDKDCDAMAAALSAAVDEHAEGIKAWTRAQAKLSEADKLAAHARVYRVAGSQMTRAQDAIRNAMSACAPNAHFQAALRKLALLDTAG
jgi:hypothetical protein